jgi:NitT/TauT family transport system substrate-binding protein
VTITIGLLLASVSACGGSASTGGAAADDHIQITVSGYPTALYGLPYEVGIDKGIFKQNRIVVDKIVPTSGGGTSVRALTSGKLAFGEVATGAALQAFNAGAPVVIVAGAVPDLNDGYSITRKDAPFNSLQDLKGRVLGYTNPGSVTEVTQRLLIDQAGLQAKDFTFKSTGGLTEGLTLLKQGQVDMVGLTDPQFTVEAAKGTIKSVFTSSQYIKQFQQTVIATSPLMVKENPDLIRRYLLSYKQSVEWIQAHPDEAGAVFGKYGEYDVTASQTVVKRLINPVHWTLALNLEGLNLLLRGSRLAGVLKPGTEITWSEALNQSFLPAGTDKLDTTKIISLKQ